MIIINEKEFAEESLQKGLTTESIYRTVGILAKYYKTCFNYKKREIRMHLIDFLKLHWPQYEYEIEYWDSFIEKSIAHAKQYPLYVFDGIRITTSEMNTIAQIKNKPLERLAFTLLCLAKFGNLKRTTNNGWVNTDAKDIFSLARITCRASERGLKMSQLYQLGLIEFPSKGGNPSVRVTYINDDDDFALFVSDFRELGYEYLKHLGENFVRCGDCRILIRGNKNGTRRYCKKCAGYTPLETQTIECIDCGEEFSVSAKNHKSIRCPECQQAFRKQYKREHQRVNRT